jgi:tetratricopeptide (TPR) repeat protein
VSPESIDQICEEIVELRAAGGRSPRYGELVSQIEDHFWKQAETALLESLDGGDEELEFSPANRLLLDMGLLDLRLVHRPNRDFLERLSAELDAPGPEGVLYMTEWFSARYRSFLATRNLPDERVADSLLLKAADQEDSELAKARAQRNELYRRVSALFKELPGIKPELATAIGRGGVDNRVEELLLAQAMDDHRAEGEKALDQSAGVQAKRYDGVVLRVLEQARERTEDEDDLKYLETIASLRMAIFRKSMVHSRRKMSSEQATEVVPQESRPDPQATRSEAENFLRTELRLLRSLLRIGSREGQVEHACSVLLNDVKRSTRGVVARVLDLVRLVDPKIGLNRDLLIAPFTGSGFFEWDRNALIIALTPARNAEEAVVNAVANFRLLDDARGAGKITAAYRAMHGSNFRQQFLADYRNWVLRAGKGKRDALSDKSYKFFVENIGPPPAGPIIPHEMGRRSVSEREVEIKRLRRLVHTGSFAPEEAYHLGVMLWQNEQIEEAIREMEKAVKASPGDGRMLYSLGLLCRRRRLVSAARKAFRETVRVSPDSIWGIYAHEALRRMV